MRSRPRSRSSCNFTCGATRLNVLILQLDAICSFWWGFCFLSIFPVIFWNSIVSHTETQEFTPKISGEKKKVNATTTTVANKFTKNIQTLLKQAETCWWGQTPAVSVERTQHSSVTSLNVYFELSVKIKSDVLNKHCFISIYIHTHTR